MDTRELLADAASRPIDSAALVLKDISSDALHAQPMGRGNTIAWLVWHAARQMDVQLSHLTGETTVWESGDWAERTGVDRGADDFGFGDPAEQVAALRVEHPDALQDYVKVTAEALTSYVRTLSDEDLDEVIDRQWDPPVTRGVRLVSVIDDAVAHIGQAQYARGLVDGWSIGV